MTSSAARSSGPWALSLLPPFPATAHRVLALVSQEHTGSKEVGARSRVGPVFLRQVLSFANSALFGRGARSPAHPGNRPARMNRIKSMATFVAVNSMVRSSVHAPALPQSLGAQRGHGDHRRAGPRASPVSTANSATPPSAAQPGHPGPDVRLSRRVLPDARRVQRLRLPNCSRRSATSSISTTARQVRISPATGVSRTNSPAPSLSHHDEPVSGERSIDNVVKLSWRLADTLGLRRLPLRQRLGLRRPDRLLPVRPQFPGWSNRPSPRRPNSTPGLPVHRCKGPPITDTFGSVQERNGNRTGRPGGLPRGSWSNDLPPLRRSI